MAVPDKVVLPVVNCQRHGAVSGVEHSVMADSRMMSRDSSDWLTMQDSKLSVINF